MASLSVASSTVPDGIDREFTGMTPPISPDELETTGDEAHPAASAHTAAVMTMDFMSLLLEISSRTCRKPRAGWRLRSGVERRISRTHDDAGLDRAHGRDPHPGALHR